MSALTLLSVIAPAVPSVPQGTTDNAASGFRSLLAALSDGTTAGRGPRSGRATTPAPVELTAALSDGTTTESGPRSGPATTPAPVEVNAALSDGTTTESGPLSGRATTPAPVEVTVALSDGTTTESGPRSGRATTPAPVEVNAALSDGTTTESGPRSGRATTPAPVEVTVVEEIKAEAAGLPVASTPTPAIVPITLHVPVAPEEPRARVEAVLSTDDGIESAATGTANPRTVLAPAILTTPQIPVDPDLPAGTNDVSGTAAILPDLVTSHVASDPVAPDGRTPLPVEKGPVPKTISPEVLPGSSDIRPMGGSAATAHPISTALTDPGPAAAMAARIVPPMPSAGPALTASPSLVPGLPPLPAAVAAAPSSPPPAEVPIQAPTLTSDSIPAQSPNPTTVPAPTQLAASGSLRPLADRLSRSVETPDAVPDEGSRARDTARPTATSVSPGLAAPGGEPPARQIPPIIVPTLDAGPRAGETPTSETLPVAETASPSAPSPSTTREPLASTLSLAAIEATAQIAAQILRRLEGRSTRFEMALTPDDLGRVDIQLDIDTEGQLNARLAFDNPAAATDLRGRADELRRQLEDAGFRLAEDALEFADRDTGSSAFDRGQDSRRGSARAFAAASRLNTDIDIVQPPPWLALTLSPQGVDMKV
jgi:hypothetical protein